MALSPEQIVSGKYRIVRQLGDGGMGTVYEAHHEVLGNRVALKLLHPEFSNTGIAKRFLQEARASARIRSQHVVGVADADQTPEGQAFIVLEYIEGRTLRQHYEDLAREGQSLARDEALDLAMQMFEGVEAAHAAGIVHRDLKPDNLMITQDAKGAPLLKILDFGIAKVDEPPESAGPALTRPGALLGTPEYMAPEQVYSAGSADVRSDVFSLGVILFEMLAGRRPVLSDDPQQIAVSYLTGAVSRLDEACPELPPALVVAIHRALAAQPRDRFPSVAEMRAAIEPFAPVRAASTNRASQLAPAPSVAASARDPRGVPETRRYPASEPSPNGASSGAPAQPQSASGPAASKPTGATPAGTHIMPASAPKPGTHVMPSSSSAGMDAASVAQPAFQADYPSAIAPFSTVQPAGPTPPPPRASSAPPPSIVHPSSRLPYGPVPAPTGWAPPAPAPKRRTGLWVAIILGILVLIAGIVLGSMYYLGSFDDPEPKPHKHPAPKHHPAPAPAPAPPPHQLR